MNDLGKAVFVEHVAITTRLRGLADALESLGVQDLGICIEAAGDIERLVKSNLALRARLAGRRASNSPELFRAVRAGPLETKGT